jgi:cell division protein FtsQ
MRIKEQRRRKKRRMRRLIALLVCLLVLAIAALIVIKVFTVEKVEIEGNELYEDAVITGTILDDEYSWNSLYVFLKYRFQKVENVPFIDAMDITLKSPHTLHVTVYEKGLVGYLYNAPIDQNVYFDKDGFVVEISSEIIEGVPRVDGLECEEIVLYEQLPIAQSVLKELLTLTQALRRNDLIPDSILYGREHSPVLVYGDVWVQLGSTTLLTQKVERIEKILPQLDGESGILHLESWSEENTNIVFDRDE